MRQSDYQISEYRNRRDNLMRCCSIAFANDLKYFIVLNTLHKAKMEYRAVAKLKTRSKHVQSSLFLIAQHAFRTALCGTLPFRKRKCFKMSEWMRWHCSTTRKEHQYYLVIAFCTILHWLATLIKIVQFEDNVQTIYIPAEQRFLWTSRNKGRKNKRVQNLRSDLLRRPNSLHADKL